MRLYLTPMDVGDVTIIEAAGRITLGENVEILRDQMHQLVGKGRRKILLNLAEVTYIDSSGIGEMVSCYTSLANLGGTVKLLKLTRRVRDLLQITKLSTVFEVFEEESEAVRSFTLPAG
jgi:anti-sigma B factor antagonist